MFLFRFFFFTNLTVGTLDDYPEPPLGYRGIITAAVVTMYGKVLPQMDNCCTITQQERSWLSLERSFHPLGDNIRAEVAH